MSFFEGIQQVVTADNNNSFTANLASNALCSGIATSTLGVAGIQVSLKTDQNCIVWIEQSPDGFNWDISDPFNYYAAIGNFGTTVQAVSSYVRVRVQNTGLFTTTYFRLQTALCPIVEAVPRSLNEDGNFKTSIYGIEDEYGFGVENTPIGEMRVVIPSRLVGAAFEGTTIDTNFWTSTTISGGTNVQANAQVVLSTNTSQGAGTILTSLRRGRYVSAAGMNYRTIVQLSAGNTSNKRRWGIAWGATMPAITDGAYFELDGSTFSIVLNKGGTETRITSGAFNGNIGANYAPGTSVHTYEIYWTNSSVWFVVSDLLLHKYSAASATWSNTMSHYIFMDNRNTGAITSNNTLSCRVASIRRLGQLDTQPTSKYQSGTTAGVICKYSPGNLKGVVIGNILASSNVTIYDGTTTGGTVLWSSGAMDKTTAPFSLDFHEIPFYTGLFFNITGGACNLTVLYE
jgi:hypothetical protein